MRFAARRVGQHKAHRHPGCAGPTGAADAVGVVGRRARQVQVDHGVQRGHVQAAGGQVGGHQNLQQPGLQIGQHLGPPALAQLAMQGGGRQTRLTQFVGHVFTAVLGGHEHQRARPAVGADQVAQQRRAALGFDHDGALQGGG